MNALLLKAAPWALAAALVVAGVVALGAHQRQIGRLQIQLHAADSLHQVAVAEANDWQRRAALDSGRAAALEADTARANATARRRTAQYVALQGPLAAARHRLDSLLALPPEPGTTGLVGATQVYVAKADSSLAACGDALHADARALAACQAHSQALTAQLTDLRGMNAALQKDTLAKARQIKIAVQGQPSAFSAWLWRLAAFGLGLVAGRVGR